MITQQEHSHYYIIESYTEQLLYATDIKRKAFFDRKLRRLVKYSYTHHTYDDSLSINLQLRYDKVGMPISLRQLRRIRKKNINNIQSTWEYMRWEGDRMVAYENPKRGNWWDASLFSEDNPYTSMVNRVASQIQGLHRTVDDEVEFKEGEFNPWRYGLDIVEEQALLWTQWGKWEMQPLGNKYKGS